MLSALRGKTLRLAGWQPTSRLSERPFLKGKWSVAEQGTSVLLYMHILYTQNQLKSQEQKVGGY